MITISRIKTGDWGKVKAYFTIKIGTGMYIGGFKLVDGANGLFVAPPSKKNKDGEYEDLVIMTREVREEILNIYKNHSDEPEDGSSAPPLMSTVTQVDEELPF